MTRIQHGDGTIVSGEYLSGCSLAAGSARKRYSNDCGSSGNHTHTISGNTKSQGSGTSFSIIPPYMTQFYAIKYAYKIHKSNTPVLKIRDQSNNWIEIPAIKGTEMCIRDSHSNDLRRVTIQHTGVAARPQICRILPGPA